MRRLLQGLSVALLLLVAGVRGGASTAEGGRPNVLMIAVDDLNDWVGCLGGHPQVKTPNLDRLAKRGMLFTNAHCAAPVCNPSRTALLTGRRPSSTGLYDNGGLWHEALPGVATIPSHFKANGYYTAGGGKIYHHANGYNRRGDWDAYFDQVFDSPYLARLATGEPAKGFTWPAGFPLNGLPSVKAMEKPPLNPGEFDWGPLDRPAAELGDDRLVEWAGRFLQNPPKQPFFLATGIFRPHLPWYAPPAYFDLYPPDTITAPPTRADDLADLPETGKRLAAQRRGDLEVVRAAGRYPQMLQAYLANISYCDALVGRLLNALDRSPAARSTVVVLWSDHGWHLGEKQALHKFTLWERSTRVPLIIAAPGVTPAGTRTVRPVGLIDLFPTLSELCGLPQPPNLDGASLAPLLRDPRRSWERPALTTHQQGNHALRTERWRYIRYRDGGEELYDHTNDPNEWTNLASRPELASVKADLSRWFPTTDAPPVPRKAALQTGEP